MAHFAKLDWNNVVTQVTVVNNDVLLDDNGNESEAKGIAFCQALFGGNWIQTSYNGKFRKNYAGKGYTYDSTRDAFIAPQPYPSWVLNEQTCRWEPPIPLPADNDPITNPYLWNEELVQWEKFVPESKDNAA